MVMCGDVSSLSSNLLSKPCQTNLSICLFFQVRDNIPTVKYIKYANHKCSWWFFTYVYTHIKIYTLRSKYKRFLIPQHPFPVYTSPRNSFSSKDQLVLLVLSFIQMESYSICCFMLGLFHQRNNFDSSWCFCLSVVHLFIVVDYPIVWICHNSFIYSPVDGTCIFFSVRGYYT